MSKQTTANYLVRSEDIGTELSTGVPEFRLLLGTESLTELQMSTLDMMYDGEIAQTVRMKLLGYPIKTLSFLPYNYIGLEL